MLTKTVAQPGRNRTDITAYPNLIGVANVAYPLILKAARPVFVKGILGSYSSKRADSGFKAIMTAYI